MDIRLDTRECGREARDVCLKACRVALFVSAVLVLTVVVRGPLYAQFANQDESASIRHPNPSYGLKFGGVRG